MPRFKVTDQQIIGRKVTISGTDYKHIVKVLRIKPDNKIILFDSKGTEYDCIVKDIFNKELVVEIINKYEINRESHLNISLFQGITKGDKMDLIVQKATELGVNSIYPVATERSEVRNTNKISRWQKIADESIKQCGRTNSHSVNTEIKFNELFDIQKSDLNLIFYENEKSLKIKNLKNNKNINSVSILIGPEGGFSENEVKIAELNNFKSIGVGPRILRSETASIAAITLLQHHFGDI
ncbi:MAG: 16S rRNA (uracil(1498)-N(3))-methyltransferase [Candidatus Dadabacteria bacterium]|nr:16S rRNA (uracil(1498)-N(3))-methyltransferase [Candidatus Dadabacteria bacterium]